jgi:hypothetical protein
LSYNFEHGSAHSLPGAVTLHGMENGAAQKPFFIKSRPFAALFSGNGTALFENAERKQR